VLATIPRSTTEVLCCVRAEIASRDGVVVRAGAVRAAGAAVTLSCAWRGAGLRGRCEVTALAKSSSEPETVDGGSEDGCEGADGVTRSREAGSATVAGAAGGVAGGAQDDARMLGWSGDAARGDTLPGRGVY